MRHRFMLVVGVLCWLPGCAAVIGLAGEALSASLSPGDPRVQTAGISRAKACAPYQPSNGATGEYTSSTYSKEAGGYVFIGSLPDRADYDPKLSQAQRLTLMTCVHALSSRPTFVKKQVAFDVRTIDHLELALWVLELFRSGGGIPIYVGVVGAYATFIDTSALHAAVTKLGLDKQLAHDFFATYGVATSWLNSQVAALDPHRRSMYFDLSKQVISARQAYFRKHQALYARFDALAARPPADAEAMVTGLEALRQDYLAVCKGDSCWYDPFMYDVTRRILLLHVTAKNAAAALAESRWFRDEHMRSNSLLAQLLLPMIKATEAQAENYAKYEAAKRSGVEDDALAAMFGGAPPVQVSADAPRTFFEMPKDEDLAAAVPAAGLRDAFGIVVATTPARGMVKITFADVINKYEAGNCVETNKVDYIASDGRIVYREHCKDLHTVTERRKVDPIFVPKQDARALRPGDEVTAIVNERTGEGAVVEAAQKNKPVQLRMHRLRK